ncbi:MAG: phage infection protein [Gemmatimonadetes bacterium]|nr:phage infection protein [Gemmatimonadota bacterium]
MALDHLRVELRNCYGIKSLNHEFDFSAPNRAAYAIYAPNGVLKTSLAQTFADHARGAPSKDRIFPTRVTERVIVDQTETEISPDAVFVIAPYDDTLGVTERTSTLLVDAALKKEYDELQADVGRLKDKFVAALRKQSKSRTNIEREVSSAFTQQDDQFYAALIRVEHEVDSQDNSPFAEIAYDEIFNDRALAFLSTDAVTAAIAGYVGRYNELLDESLYFSRDTFNYYNANQVAKVLTNNGFFDAHHSVRLNSALQDDSLDINSLDQLQAVVAREKDRITTDPALKETFGAIEKQLDKNIGMRKFRDYLAEHPALLHRLSNLATLREDIFKSYFRANYELYKELTHKYRQTSGRTREIEEKAREQRTQWENVIDIFNERFFVPFRLELENREAVILGHDPMPRLGFVFQEEVEGGEETRVGRDTLMRALSNGEKKALYILNIIFEVEAREKTRQETLFVVDDIADSFDYRNKYAIIQYLMEMAEKPYFRQILLTHNFDFFRTVQSRFVRYNQCLVATKARGGLSLDQARGIKNPFVKDWRMGFFTDPRRRVASIPFLRNLIEYTRGDDTDDFGRLTALVHWKTDSQDVRQSELDDIYGRVFEDVGKHEDPDGRVVDMIERVADECAAEASAREGLALEKKIGLAVATRLLADRYMISLIDDATFAESISANQSQRLFRRFEDEFGGQEAVRGALAVLRRVLLMTPENIHLNAFMYEPLVDMSGEHLQKLYREVKALDGGR